MSTQRAKVKGNKIVVLVLLSLLVFLFLMVGCGGEKQQAGKKEGWPEAISIGTATMGGTYYVVGSGIAGVISKYVGISANAEATQGSLQNAQTMAEGKQELAIISTDSAYEMAHKTGSFAGRDWPITTLCRGHVSSFNIATLARSGIKKFEDIKGKSVAWQLPGSPIQEKGFRALLEAHGLTESDIKSQVVGPVTDACERLKEGRVDVVFYLAMPPGQAFAELATTADVYFIPIAEEKIKQINEKYPFLVSAPIPAGTYRGQSQEVSALGNATILAAHRDLPEELVYEITKAIFEHGEEIAAVHPAGAQYIDLDHALDYKLLPFHPGAVKYYKEKGIWKE